jgi:hypothetical protein
MQLYAMLLSLYDQLDEISARRLRSCLGQERWIVSWVEESSELDRWRARVSCPQIDLTLERVGSTRCRAIRRARRALAELLDAPPLPAGRARA